MTHFDPLASHDGAPSKNTRRQTPVAGFGRRKSVPAVILIVAVVGIGKYWLTSNSRDGPARAQERGMSESAHFLVKDGERIKIPPGSPLRGKLVIATVAMKEIQRSLVLPAVVEADPARTVKVLPPVSGRVTELKIQLGERVGKGDVLAVIESGDVAQAFADNEKARAAEKLAKLALDRLFILEKTRAISVKDREQAQNDLAQAQAELERTERRLRTLGVPAEGAESTRLLSVKAPTTGSVIDLQMAPGAYLNDITAAIATIADLGTVWVTANVPEKDTARVSKGQSVEVVFTAYPGEVFNGKVLFVSDVLDSDTRRTKVRIAFENTDLRFKPNMFASATFLAPKQTLPVVPTSALVLRNEADQVFVEIEPWVFEARPVEVAFQEGDQAIVTRGLTAGEHVVVQRAVLLND
jgi:cobalt-zinc-cadmium efflux system membrane fusion protein